MAEDNGSQGGFWTTLPGLLSGLAAVIVAIGGILTVLVQNHVGPFAQPPATVAVAVTSAAPSDAGSSASAVSSSAASSAAAPASSPGASAGDPTASLAALFGGT
ncbi:MAG: hypothetical protein IAI49_07520, partial [Candidatus Eremiobacteraeota bacterium]|nr:hypothetical protein [Candidatus Eremiobacteraeota bacterium]